MRKVLYSILVAGVIGVCLIIPGAVQAQKIDPTKVTASLKAAGGTVGGIGYVQVTAFSKIVEEMYPKIKISIVPGAWIGNIFRTNKGELDIGSSTLVMCKLAHYEKGPFPEPLPNVRALVSVQDDNYYFAVVRKDFPADSVGEIVKKKMKARLCTLSRGNATEWIWRMTFTEMGVKWEDVDRWGGKMNFVAWADAVSLVKDGHADGILAVGAEGIGWLTELATVRDVKWLKWDADLYQAMIGKFGFLEGKRMRAGSFRGMDQDVLAPADSGVFVVRTDLPDDVVYTLVKALAENEGKFQAFHKGLRTFKAADMAKNTGLPLHKGAEIYYQDKGLLK
ncbi:MAG: TAXI family TRAP transporter solute-binding subunit [Deltaproteobacteria bacterium]|nr:TAXI family TRAP transporter solute-binding subunit [Deltaproteobacteria bacterium]